MNAAQAIFSRIKDVTAPVQDVYTHDEVDIAILRVLSEDARMSQRQVAAALGISAPTVSERMARLERAGVIKGYAAQINWAALGYSQVVYLTISASRDHDIAEVMRGIWALPEAQEVTLISGDVDLLVQLRVRDHSHLRELLMDQIWQITGLQGTSTQIAIADMPAKNFSMGMLSQLEQRLTKSGKLSGG
ncbi:MULTISPECIES: Lrp/AsnC family transcriptional regulator [Pseudomonas]|uniref:Lrp/AsnC family transcriptional regulator n=1 Tax=Pseudomonas TaxID=286 RepID=UPI0012D42368|nr:MULTISPECIES: Lrp/AsnC family transcriptional regulator [Pseudomonas]